MKIKCVATIPDHLYGDFLQHIRDFDTKYDPHHEGIVDFEMVGTDSSLTVEQTQTAMRGVDPAFNFELVFRKE